MTPDRPVISVVVATVPRRRDYLLACLRGIGRCEGVGNSEVLVVTEEVEEMADLLAAAAEIPPVRILEGPAALSGKRNLGALAARAEIVAFVDDDAIPAPGWLEGLRRAFEAGAAVVGGRIEPAFEAPLPTYLVGREHLVRGYNSLGDWRRDGFLIGANFAVRRSVFGECGLFHPDFGRGGHRYPHGEETEFAARVAGRHPAVFAEGALVRHAIQAHRTGTGYLARRSFEAGVTGAGIDERTRRDFGRNVVACLFMVPVVTGRSVRRREWLAGLLRVLYLGGYVLEAIRILAFGRGHACPAPAGPRAGEAR